LYGWYKSMTNEFLPEPKQTLSYCKVNQGIERKVKFDIIIVLRSGPWGWRPLEMAGQYRLYLYFF